MLNKVSTLAAAAVLVVNSFACGERSKEGAPTPTPEFVSGVLPAASPEEVVRIKNLVFADVTLTEFMRGQKVADSERQEEPGRSLFRAVEEIDRGRKAEAKKTLRQLLAMPELETRVRLLVWNSLRELGERPAPEEARKVRGVVCELHNEAGVGTLAVYADGTLRWIGGQGKISIIDSPGASAELDSLVGELLKSGEPVVRKFPAGARRRPGEPPLEHFRVSVLTFGGIHVAEVYGPSIDEPGHFAAPILYASARLAGEAIPALEQKHQAAPPPPPANER